MYSPSFSAILYLTAMVKKTKIDDFCVVCAVNTQICIICLLTIETGMGRINAEQEFDQIPTSKVVYLLAHFTCGTQEYGFFTWRVDGIEARLPEVQNRIVSYVNSGGISTLSIAASLYNNNSEIVCLVRDLSNGEEIARTPQAYLQVQGELIVLMTVFVHMDSLK